MKLIGFITYAKIECEMNPSKTHLVILDCGTIDHRKHTRIKTRREKQIWR